MHKRKIRIWSSSFEQDQIGKFKVFEKKCSPSLSLSLFDRVEAEKENYRK